jgi:predicted aldo/keto reductase-like oxidoreductase
MSRDPVELKNHIRQSLQQLGIDYIDLYQFHNISTFDTLEQVLTPGGLLSVVEEAQQAGLVRHIGITSHQHDVAREAIKSDRFETIMFPFNFITREPAEELIPLAAEHDMGFIAMKPLAGGMLDNATLAFKYILQFPNVFPIPGIQFVREIEEIVRIAEGPLQLTEAEQAEIQMLREKLGTTFCRRCDYCQPCTAGIAISFVMDIPSLITKTLTDKIFEEPYPGIISKAGDCVECGDCEERCPYHLPIREMMAKHFEMYREARQQRLEQTKT